jgi:hypothetical protein
MIWSICRIAATADRLGTVEVPEKAIEKAAAEFNVRATKLTALRR